MPPRPLRKKLRPAPPPGPDPSAWSDAQFRAVLDAFGSFVGNAAKKHGEAPSEVVDLVRDHRMAPDPDG